MFGGQGRTDRFELVEARSQSHGSRQERLGRAVERSAGSGALVIAATEHQVIENNDQKGGTPQARQVSGGGRRSSKWQLNVYPADRVLLMFWIAYSIRALLSM